MDFWTTFGLVLRLALKMKTACKKFWGFSNSLDPNDNGRLNPELGTNSSFNFDAMKTSPL
jgi:hypothetical protein